MSLDDTATRLAGAALIVLALFAIAFLVGRGSSSEAALAPVREQTAKASAALRHAPLRAIGSVPALPRAPRTRTRASSPPPPPAAGRPVTPVAPPPPPPVPCVGEVC